MLLAPKHLPRLAATIGLFTKYGLKDFAQRQGLLSLATPEGDVIDEELDSEMADRAASFRKRLVELGPAYVKLGQVLSTRPDLIPEQYIHELEKLQDDVGPIPLQDIERTIEEELGARLGKLFAEFEPDPIGTASLGQVHGAVLRDGREVVVKVQRPGIRPQLVADIEYFRELASFMTNHTEAGTRIDLLGVIQQLERALAEELDYRVEARNGATLRRSLAEFPRLLIPRVIEAYSTHRVLTTERVRGIKISEIPSVTRVEHDFEAVADELAKAYLKQITIDGHFHADPHPGNLFVVLPGMRNPRTPSEIVAGERRAETRPALTPLSRVEQSAREQAAPLPDDIGVRVALIDFGMTARLSASLKDGVVRLLMEIADNRGDDAAETLSELGSAIESFDREAYSRDIAALVARNYDLSVGEVQAGRVLYEVINISYQKGLRLPAELTLLAKTLFNLDAVTRALDPAYSPITAIRDYTNEIANERAKREFSPRRIYQMVSEASDLLRVLPRRLDVVSERMAANEFGFRIDAPQVGTILNGLQKVANRIFSGTVLAGLLIASAMLHQRAPRLGMTGFTVAALLGLYMILSIVFSDHRDRKR